MSFLKGFSAAQVTTPPTEFHPVFQKLLQEHTKTVKLLAQSWKYGKDAVKSTDRGQCELWLFTVQQMYRVWKLVSFKEDRVLIPVLAQYMDVQVGPLAVLRFERDEIEKVMQSFESEMEQLLREPELEPDRLARLFDRYQPVNEILGELYPTHINKIYRLSQSLLSQAELASMYERMKKLKFKVECRC